MSLFKKRTSKLIKGTELTGERRQLTVLFYDIVGATSLVDGNDPEALRAVLDLIHAAARDTITDHGGSIEQVMGDGGMAYFGYPVADEDAALSAVTAALDLQLARTCIEGAPSIRIGIATSVVVLPDTADALASGRLGAVGVAPNLAARLEAAAQPNQILVGAATYALARRAIEFEPVDGLILKGFSDISRVWRPVVARPIASRFKRDRDGSGQFSGRETEISTLNAAWDIARTGAGTAILIEGEPGIGKSRIVSELERSVTCADAGGRIILLQCQPRTEGDALFAIVGMYERAFDEASDPDLAVAAQNTAERLGLLEEDDALNAIQRRKAIVSAVIEELQDLARNKPLLIIAEDLHWADEVTLDVLGRLGAQACQHSMLVVGTSRQGAGMEDLKATFDPLPLSPFDSAEARALVNVSALTQLESSTCDWIIERADGNPLFLTELTAFVVETIAAGGAPSDIQSASVSSLSDLLSTRLDSAGVAKRTAQIASVLGREHGYHLLVLLTASSHSLHELNADLQRLIDHGISDIINNGYDYTFRHALVREAAYDSQLRSVRQALHGKIVDLVEAHPNLAESVPEIVLAEHCLAAKRIGRGTALLLDVAEESIRRSALRAPYSMLQRVLSLSEEMEPSLERDSTQLKAITLLGPLITLLEGPRSAAPFYERGEALYFVLPETERAQFFPVLWGWWFTASNLIEQTRRSEVLIRDVTPQADPESRLQALHCGWASLFDVGAHDRCLSTISDGLALYDADVGQRSRYLYGHDAKVCGLGERALSGWLTGQHEVSRDAVATCEAWADDTAHLSSQLHGLDIATQVAFFNHDLPEIDRILFKMQGLSDAGAVPVITAKRQIFRGWMAARAGDTGQIVAVRNGLSAVHKFGVLEDVPFYADIAADVAAASGSVDSALGPLKEAIEDARKTGLTYWLPELLRRMAILSDGAVAAQALDEGFEIAKRQNAQMLVLRNAASRLDMGHAISQEHRVYIAEKIGLVSDCDVRRKVLNALDL